MPSFHPFHTFLSARCTNAQRTRIARRRQKAAHDAQPDRHLFDRLQRTINTQLNGIVGVLEMIRQHELTSEQRELIGLAQRSANTLLSDTGRLFDGDAFADDTAMHIDDTMRDVRVLVVTPDAALRTRIENELMHRDMRATGVERADAALTALEQAAAAGDPYRIALLDQDIHGIDGETLGSAIGNAPAHRDTLIVLISSEHDRQDADRIALAGFSAWLPKPAPRPMLVDTLAMLCDCIAKKDAPRFICAGICTQREQPTPESVDSFSGSFADSFADSFAQARVMVVDDNPVNLEVAERMLTRFGCLVDTAAGGEQALELAEARRYDLILMDCQMPGVDGYQATALLRAAEGGLKHTPIIGWSSRTNRNERDTCLAIGMDDFLAKPMRMRELSAILVRCLQRTAKQSQEKQDDELDATRQMFGDDFPELARLFLADSPQRLNALREAIDRSDAAAIAKLAHVLCGSSASLGATLLAALSRELEVAARNGALHEARPRLDTIAFEYARIEARLNGMLQSPVR